LASARWARRHRLGTPPIRGFVAAVKITATPAMSVAAVDEQVMAGLGSDSRGRPRRWPGRLFL